MTGLRRPWANPANPLVQFIVASLLLFGIAWWATGIFSQRAARSEALADARVTTELLAHSVAEPALPRRLVDGDPGAIDRFDRAVHDRLQTGDVRRIKIWRPDGRIVYNLLDGHTVAVDAATGAELWRTKMGDIDKGETITMAPIVVKGKVIVGSSGGEMGVRGWIAAVDLATGKEVWRSYNLGPDADMKVGPRFKPFYAADRGAGRRVSDPRPDGWEVTVEALIAAGVAGGQEILGPPPA